MKYNYVALLLGYIQVFLHPEILDFLPINFYTFCPYLESLICFHGKDLIVQSLYVHLKDKKQGGSKLMFMPFEISQYLCMALVLFLETCCTAVYSHLYK